ncbi:MAG: protein translocase subunit SecD [Rhodospirillaceae bacterium]|jgi:preprotein translocase subunit SecD|nr:protein translocase subunit SecD [Rhodospirillaceae bacterium]MBT3926514.1 protein translocase subunit SecD [Rhodospirillaceae bacterium]MBT4425385.1 protein translocase subunit SecD [Rhodospirillaceae bacterium]MBT5039925.1 protein translocase subunit SecD [Rhodospirillaceae bacterium]MBT5676581.1 protein translocase subunit SecD [Rhodospirillaceae bacterium]
MLRIRLWQVIVVVLICAASILFAVPNLFNKDSLGDSYPDWLPSQQVNLGLDLQGGSHLLLEVQIENVLIERIDALVDDARSALRGERIGYTSLKRRGLTVVFQLTNLENLEAAHEVLFDLDRELQIQSSDDGAFELSLTESAITARKISALGQSIEIIRRRIDETGVAEPTIQRQGEDRILVQLPGLDDPERLKRLLGKTAKMSFHLVDQTVTDADLARGRLPPGTMKLPADDEVDNAGNPRYYPIRKRVMVSGDSLVDSQPTFQDNQAVVNFRFDTSGAKKFGRVTQENVGRPFAIVLDGKVISAPVIREAILGGSGVISGNFNTQSARDLALLLRAGALPAPMKILEERTVGPDLGADSIDAGKIASLIGLAAVIVFMLLYYGLFGIVADIALILNLVIILGLLSVLQATLTLPGIAGIVLTIGMAVDANVLIFERIREEVKGGRSPFSAMEAGYKRAFTTIFDSNLTTLIAAFILYIFGSGPVQGFAVTLGIGIVTSMFTAMLVSRYILVWWLKRTRPKTLPL